MLELQPAVATAAAAKASAKESIKDSPFHDRMH